MSLRMREGLTLGLWLLLLAGMAAIAWTAGSIDQLGVFRI